MHDLYDNRETKGRFEGMRERMLGVKYEIEEHPEGIAGWGCDQLILAVALLFMIIMCVVFIWASVFVTRMWIG